MLSRVQVLSYRTDYCSVEDPNRPGSDLDQDPGSHVHPDPAPKPNKIQMYSDPDASKKFQNILKSELLQCHSINVIFRMEVLFSTNFVVCIHVPVPVFNYYNFTFTDK